MKTVFGWFLIGAGMTSIYYSISQNYGFLGSALAFIIFAVGLNLIIDCAIESREVKLRDSLLEELYGVRDSLNKQTQYLHDMQTSKD